MDRKRPGGLLAIAIIGIGLGVLGGCLGVYSVVMTTASGAVAALQEQAAEMQPDEAQREMQRELNRRVLEIQARYRVRIIAHQGLNLLTSLLLLIGAIAVVRWKKSAPALITAAAIANGIVDLGGSVVTFIMQRETNAVMTEVMTDLPSGPPGMERTMEGVLGASAAMSVCWLAVVLLAKLGFYAWSATYVRKPRIRGLFEA